MKARKALVVLIAVSMIASASAQGQGLMDPGIKPGSPFYIFDQMSESFESALASLPVLGSPALKAKVQANHAEERLAEANALTKTNRSELAEKAMARYNRGINSAQESASQINDSELDARLRNVTGKHVVVLEDVRKRVPAQAQAAIDQAINSSSRIAGPTTDIPRRGAEIGKNGSTVNSVTPPGDGKDKPEVRVGNKSELVPGNPPGRPNRDSTAGGSMEPPSSSSQGPSIVPPSENVSDSVFR